MWVGGGGARHRGSLSCGAVLVVPRAYVCVYALGPPSPGPVSLPVTVSSEGLCAGHPSPLGMIPVARSSFLELLTLTGPEEAMDTLD